MADAGVAVAARPLGCSGQPERRDDAEHLLQRDADLQAGQVGAEAEVRRRDRTRGAGWDRVRPRTDPHPRTARRPGWPIPPRRPPCRPGRCADRPARRARWPCGASTATVSSSAGSPRWPAPWAPGPLGAGPTRRATGQRPASTRQSRCGWSRHPAENSSEKKAASSSWLRTGGSASGRWAWITTDNMSGPGWARFSAMRSVP